MRIFFYLFTMALTFFCEAQIQNFGSYPGFIGNNISSIAVQPDGKVLIGGEFTNYNGLIENGIIRLNADGTKDTSFNTGDGLSDVSTIVVQADGKILVGGAFTEYNGVSKIRIIRLNLDGSIDTTFTSGSGFHNTVLTIAIQQDGKILIGGRFDIYNGFPESLIIRLNSDGTKDTTFNSAGFTGYDVSSIALQTNGKILVGGNFSEYNEVTENNIIRLNEDGTKDTSFTTGSGFNSTVNSLTVQNDGKVLVGGYFTEYNGVTENRIIRLNTDGSKDSGFNTGSGLNDYVMTISLQLDGKILVGGRFTEYNGVTENKIIRLNTDGTKDSSFNAGSGLNNSVEIISLQSDGKILVGGRFTEYNGVPRKCNIRLNTNGTRDISYITGNGFNGTVYATYEQADGKILVGGDFTEYNWVAENGIIRLNADGSKDTSFNTGTGFNINNTPTSSNTSSVNSIAVQTDGKILIGGSFTEYNGLTENKIIRLNADGSKDTSFNTGTGFNTTNGIYVSSIAIQTNGKILLIGNFTEYSGVTENKIIRLNVDGTKDTSFNTGSGFNGSVVKSIALQNDGKILVGGYFTEYDGVAENHIIRLNIDGTKDTSLTTGTGFNSTVYSITVQNDGKILVGGYFTEYDGVAENHIIRLNVDGTKDTSLTTGTGFNSTVYSITVQNDGKILVSGTFSTYNGILYLNDIIRLNTDGTRDTSFTTGTGFNGSIYTITVQSNGNILAGGGYIRYLESGDSAFLIALQSLTLSNDTFANTKSFSLWPNPTNDLINLSIPDYNTKVNLNYILFDMNGRVLQQNSINKLETQISLNKLTPGLYLIEVKSNNSRATKRFIKQ